VFHHGSCFDMALSFWACVLDFIVLRRCRRKAYNSYDLAVVIAERFEEVFVERLLDVALGRRKAMHNTPSFTSTISADMIIAEDDHQFIVRSENDPLVSYCVDTSLMLCTCIAGNGGKFCKHLAAIESFFPSSVNVCRTTSSEERFQLAILAVGMSEAPDRSLFGLADAAPPPLDILQNFSSFNSTETALSSAEDNALQLSVEQNDFHVEIEDDNDEVQLDSKKYRVEVANATLMRFYSMVEQNVDNPDLVKAMKSMDNAMSKMVNSSQFLSAVHLFGKESVWKSGRHSKKIKVQPTGIARRAEGKPRGPNALSKGRPRNSRKTACQGKRDRNLAKNINLNRPNAKSHGATH